MSASAPVAPATACRRPGVLRAAAARGAAWAAVLATALLTACGQPVPPEKAAYVGQWRAEQMTLRISADGRVEYRRSEGGMSTKISAPIQRFDGPHFEVGVGPISTRFTVSSPPQDDGDGPVRMTVDGVVLTRAR